MNNHRDGLISRRWNSLKLGEGCFMSIFSDNLSSIRQSPQTADGDPSRGNEGHLGAIQLNCEGAKGNSIDSDIIVEVNV